MSAVLLEMTLAYLRSKFTKAEVAEVKPYAGEFSGAEIDRTGYVCPTIFVTVLGWTPGPGGKRLAGRNVRAVHMAAFIATKHATSREKRMLSAMNLADRLSLALCQWTPEEGDAPFAVAPVDEDPTCENLYGRAVDKAGQALWLVKWVQDTKALVPPEQLFDLLSVAVTSDAHPGVVPGALPPVAPPLPVSHEINFPTEEP